MRLSGCKVVKMLKGKFSCFILVERMAQIFLYAENVVFLKIKPSDPDTFVIMWFISVIVVFNGLLL